VKKSKKGILLICIICLSAMLCLPAAAAMQGYSWYCKRTNDHTQPQIGGDISFVEKYDGFAIDKNHGDSCDDKVIYLTFDAGYENGNVGKTLDILRKHNVKGAFFVLGHLIEDNTALVNKMFDDGHLVCNHTYSHACMVGKSREEFQAELSRLESVCIEKTGREISKFYRPPEGRFDEESLSFAQEMGYKTVFWSFAYADWDNNNQMSPGSAKKKILDNIHNGAIFLLHPTSRTNAQVLEDVIRELKNQGYRFGTLDELCQ